MTPTDIIPVPPANTKLLTQFIDYPHTLYANDPLYVPMLYMEQEALLNPKKSPFYQHSTAAYFLAKRGGDIVGRIAAIRNNNHIQFTGKQEGFFGFFDCENNQETANRLLDTAAQWLRDLGLNMMQGPSNFSTNETVGVLVDNFSEPPFIMMTYNAPYYKTLLENYGMQKMTDLWCWELPTKKMDTTFLEKASSIEKRLTEKGVTIRQINMKQFNQDLNTFLPVYNQSWSENTGFVPMTDAEVRQIAKDLKPVVDKDFIYFAEKDGKCIGVALAIPNVNEVQIKLKRGRLLPFGFITLLTGLKKIKSVRILALGTLKEYRRLGVDAVFYAKLIQAAQRRGIERGEASWILEKNDLMNRAMENIGGRMYRTYRLYEKKIV